MAQISIKILLERFTDVRGPVNDSSCLRKPREPRTLDEVVHLEVGFCEEQISWRIRLLFLKNKCVLDTLVWLLFLEHPKTSPPWPRKREHKSTAIIHWTGKTCRKNPILSAPFVDNTIILCQKMKQIPWILSQQRWWMTRHVFSLQNYCRFYDSPDSRLSTRLTSGDDIIRKKLINLTKTYRMPILPFFFTAITHSAIDSLNKINVVSRKNANVWKKYPLRQLFILHELIGNQFVGEQKEPVKID